MWKGWITYPRGGELRLLALGVVFSNLAPDRNGLTVSRIVTMSTETLRRLDPYFMAPTCGTLLSRGMSIRLVGEGFFRRSVTSREPYDDQIRPDR